MECLIAIDIGSSRIKCIVLDLNGSIMQVTREDCELQKRSGGFAERDPAVIWAVVLKLLVRIDSYAREQDHRVVGITCTGAGDGLLLIDGKGEPVTYAISSLDTRSSRDLEAWNESPEASAFYSLTGEIPFAGTPVALLRWLKKHQREIYDKGSHILFIKDWIKYRLTGVICTDFTDSSATLTKIDGTYERELFALTGIEESFSKTVEQISSHDIIGKVSDFLGTELPSLASVPVFSGVHDCTGSALGSGCFKNGDLCMITGSWAGNDLVVDTPLLDLRPEKHWLIRSYAIEGKYLMMSSSPTAFVNLDWFAATHAHEIQGLSDNFGKQPLVKLCDEIVTNSNIDAELCYHPYLFGSQLIPTATAGFNGLKPWHGIQDLLRAVYEGIGFNYRNHFDDLQGHFPVSRVTLCGGGSNSNIFLSILASILERGFAVSRCPETTSLGAFIPAAVGLGLFPTYEEACSEVCKQYTETIAHDSHTSELMERKFKRYEIIKTALEQLWKSDANLVSLHR